ncbi:hypothetical protein ACFWMQ_07495 [Streptomyces sp. NPDC058372]|uniref:hypothetical protein n=1 Tax=Streptomyces sp. NPDC058372 TaxID=3346464 RepID=UPI00365DB41E
MSQLHRWPPPKTLPDASALAALGVLVEDIPRPGVEHLLSRTAVHERLESLLAGLRILCKAYEEATHPSLNATVRSARRLLARADREPAPADDEVQARIRRAAALLKGLLDTTERLVGLAEGPD